MVYLLSIRIGSILVLLLTIIIMYLIHFVSVTNLPQTISRLFCNQGILCKAELDDFFIYADSLNPV